MLSDKPPPTVYDLMGGDEIVRKLVDRFYDLMDSLPEVSEIRQMHPDDLTQARDKLYKFLSGLFGGPPLYHQEYGHPMLRARHLPFPIGESERDQWLLCMNRAVDEILDDSAEMAPIKDRLKSNFFRTADHMRNQD